MTIFYRSTITSLLFLSSFCAFAQNALHFDGSNDYVQTTFDGVTGTTSRTFEAWVKVDVGASTSNLCILDYGTNAVGSRNSFSVKGDRGLTFISGGTNANISSPANGITEGQWTHVAFVLNSGTGYLYINGVQVGTGNLSTVNTPTGNTDLRIGERVSGGSIPFEGAIDEVRMWNVARTQSEISNNRNAEFCTVPANLVAYYNFNQGTASGNNSGVTSLHNAINNANGSLKNFSLSGSSSNWVSGTSITAGLTVSKNKEEACDSLISPSGNYTWKNSGIYYDTVSNANSCDSIMRFDVTINTGLYTVVNDTSCDPYMSPSGNYTYYTSGQYFDTTMTSKGCMHVHELNLELNVIDTSVSLSGSTLTSNQASADSYQWLYCDNNNAPLPGATNQSYTPGVDGNYAVEIELGECMATSACVGVFFIGIDETSSLNAIQLYPNPVEQVLFVKSPFAKGELNFEVLSTIGEVVLRGSLSDQIDVSSLESGMYYVRFSDGGNIATLPFLKN